MTPSHIPNPKAIKPLVPLQLTHFSREKPFGPGYIGNVILLLLLLLLLLIFYSHTVNEYGPGFVSIMGIEFTYCQGISS